MVKYADVARALGISKATVSLVINNRPGVSEETRRLVLNQLEQMEADQKRGLSAANRMIKVVVVNHRKNTMYDPEMDLWTPVFNTFERLARLRGYSFSVANWDDEEQTEKEILRECEEDAVAGVIVFATEAREEDRKFWEKIRKPVVLYDFEDKIRNRSSVCIDGYLTLYLPIRYLLDKGIRDVVYFSTSIDIYNFDSRRNLYKTLCDNYEIRPEMEVLGGSIEEIYQNARIWLEKRRFPRAMIFENYQVSIGMLSAMNHMSLALPYETELIGIDEIPSYVLQRGIKFSCVKIPHAERAEHAFNLLMQEIENPHLAKCRIEVAPSFEAAKTR